MKLIKIPSFFFSNNYLQNNAQLQYNNKMKWYNWTETCYERNIQDESELAGIKCQLWLHVYMTIFGVIKDTWPSSNFIEKVTKTEFGIPLKI